MSATGSTDLAGWRADLDAAMEERGSWPQRSPWIRDAVRALPRDRFAPDRLWRWDGHAYRPVDRQVDGALWARELYASADAAAVTQVTGGLATSSLSSSGIVVDMLDSLLLEPGHRVLELGTGAGWNAALAAHRAGPGMVTSVEVDPVLANAARARLPASVRVEVGDGGAGWPAAVPYDRVIATYAVERVPWAWIEQCAPGGRVVTPWGRLGYVALGVAPDGSHAVGWMQGLAQFMPARDSSRSEPQFREVRGLGPAEHESVLDRDLEPLRADWDLLFTLRVALPDLRITTAVDQDGTSAWLHDGRGSWATLSARPSGGARVHGGGPRRLADELAAAWAAWEAEGRPGVYDYGMTVRPDRQYVWLNDPDTGPRWLTGQTVPKITE
ncbi:protein-L-isoaspartate O-methyltransferase [Kitasatospora sp. MAA4]|uniref:methyltransferase domain-containing protein n=1 Tax=Kitasatospora sp. MAA4 TaxID=3035093 RepID=UPI002475146D|nr:methyltransferase domain-containing protein [Kitasatospora sp. MAA4]MDH6136839.1 protein-L-isoaspartate O-methyltransferase [Kitasatospora sp. MAA4]